MPELGTSGAVRDRDGQPHGLLDLDYYREAHTLRYLAPRAPICLFYPQNTPHLPPKYPQSVRRPWPRRRYISIAQRAGRAVMAPQPNSSRGALERKDSIMNRLRLLKLPLIMVLLFLAAVSDTWSPQAQSEEAERSVGHRRTGMHLFERETFGGNGRT